MPNTVGAAINAKGVAMSPEKQNAITVLQTRTGRGMARNVEFIDRMQRAMIDHISICTTTPCVMCDFIVKVAQQQ